MRLHKFKFEHPEYFVSRNLLRGSQARKCGVQFQSRHLYHKGRYFRHVRGRWPCRQWRHIFLTGTNAGVTWSGGGTYNLSATTSGPLAGFVIYIDPNSSGMTKSHISGGGNTTYVGAMYFPKQQLIISGTGSTTDPSPFTALVADTFLYSGTSTLSVGVDPTKTSVPVPSGLYVGAVDSPYITN